MKPQLRAFVQAEVLNDGFTAALSAATVSV